MMWTMFGKLLVVGGLLGVLSPAGEPAAEREVEPSRSPAEWAELLGSPDAAERALAAEKLGRMDAQAAFAVPALAKALEDEDVRVRVTAAWALARIGPPAEAAIPALVRALEDDSESPGLPVWVMASLALGEIGPKAVPALITAVQSHKKSVCRGAAGALYIIGPEAREAVPVLMKVLEEGYSTDTRISAIYALGGIGPEAKAAVPLLIKTLDSEDFHARYFAARALGAIGPEAKAAVPALQRKLKEGVVSVRRHAAGALGDIGPVIGKEGVQSLIEALDDPLEPVREKAVIALSKLGPLAAPAVPVIREKLAQNRLAARSQAARTLWKLTGQTDEAMAVLLRELDETRDPLGAAEVLEEMGPAAAAAVPALTQRLSSLDADIRLYAARALGEMGPAARAALPELRKLLRDPEEDVRETAREAVAKLEAKP